MLTPTHALLTAVATTSLKQRGVWVKSGAAIIGSVAPDVPFAVMTIGTWLLGGSVTELHMVAFFEHPWVIALHNIPHSLITVVLLFLLVSLLPKNTVRYWLFWFTLGLLVHILLDIPSHVDDGPMLLYPLSQYRFSGPISYWDPEHGGLWFLGFEILLIVACTLRLIFFYRKDHKQ